MLFGNTKPKVFLFQVVKTEKSNNSSKLCYSCRKKSYIIYKKPLLLQKFAIFEKFYVSVSIGKNIILKIPK